MASRAKAAELLRWARIGAEARLAELEAEKARLLKTFPELQATEPAESRTGQREPGRRMSAAARKRISEMMTKRWADYRRRTKNGT